MDISTFHWTATHVAAIGDDHRAPVIEKSAPVLPGTDLWDHWPIIDRQGRTVKFSGGPLVIALTAPVMPDPEARHAVARLRLMQKRQEGWLDLGHLLPDDLNPGSREWAGTAVLEEDGKTLSLYYTSAGVRGEAVPTFLQRMLLIRGTLRLSEAGAGVNDWTTPEELFVPDDRLYRSDMTGGGAVGTIKAFRDPFPVIHPETGEEFILFSASKPGSPSDWNGLIGVARREGGVCTFLPPLVDADRLNNELERPHMVRHGGRFYLFWSTQAKVFAAGGPRGPNGLYGVVSDNLLGPWRLLNGTGLVVGNPEDAPFQAYSWLVLDDLSVWSFADLVGLATPARDPAEARSAFAGSPAPVLQIALDGDSSSIVA
ncbi:glycoside hydrolase family 68 protein [Sphingobium amiense]|uniref:glycoside hydrolase family 68 protein n=1 Tax=Sphingobium amiense TaxID=135719 RepID=UPI001E379D99|nr:glycoside hydrolase family 68 protein [Sphingobium amiense]